MTFCDTAVEIQKCDRQTVDRQTDGLSRRGKVKVVIYLGMMIDLTFQRAKDCLIRISKKVFYKPISKTKGKKA